MISARAFADKHYAVFGLARTGLSVVAALRAAGAAVTVWDDDARKRAAIEDTQVHVADLNTADLSGFDGIVVSPGVPLNTHPLAARAAAAGVAVLGDIELFAHARAELPPHKVVGITGTNGKSTTTALIAHILREAGRDVQLGGNIGTPILALEPPAADRVHVIEMSSYQIDLTPSLNPGIGILLNLSPDHIDRHGTMDHYAAVKARLVKLADTAIIGVDDPYSEAIAVRGDHSGKPIVRISLQEMLGAGIHVRGREIFAWRGHGRKLADLTGIGSLRGDHNAQNAAAAVAACLRLGLDEATIQRGLSSFPGLAHRMEEVGRVGKAILINDSKATNADSTEKALLSFPGGIFWILGGKAKDGGITPLAPYFPRIAKAYLIGAASEEFATTLEGKVPFERSGTLEAAVSAAAADAKNADFAEPVILLSPSCASFDQFPNFEVRGQRFRELAEKLPGYSAR